MDSSSSTGGAAGRTPHHRPDHDGQVHAGRRPLPPSPPPRRGASVRVECVNPDWPHRARLISGSPDVQVGHAAARAG